MLLFRIGGEMRLVYSVLNGDTYERVAIVIDHSTHVGPTIAPSVASTVNKHQYR